MGVEDQASEEVLENTPLTKEKILLSGQAAFTSNLEKLKIQGLSYCTGVIIYDPVSKNSLALHASEATNLSRLATSALPGSFQESFPVAERLKVWLGGAGWHSPPEIGLPFYPVRDSDAELNQWVALEFLEGLGITKEQIRIKFNKKDESMTMRITPEAGEVRISHTSEEGETSNFIERISEIAHLKKQVYGLIGGLFGS